MEEARILVVEDEAVLRRLLADILRRQGFTVDTASDGAEALRLLDAPGDYDLVITDLQMPSVGGLELLGLLRARGVPVEAIAMTGLLTVTIAKQTAELGVFTVLAKPFDLEPFMRSVRSALERARARR